MPYVLDVCGQEFFINLDMRGYLIQNENLIETITSKTETRYKIRNYEDPDFFRLLMFYIRYHDLPIHPYCPRLLYNFCDRYLINTFDREKLKEVCRFRGMLTMIDPCQTIIE